MILIAVAIYNPPNRSGAGLLTCARALLGFHLIKTTIK